MRQRRRRWRRRGETACDKGSGGGSVGGRAETACRWCHVETENEILTGEIKIYVKDMSGHKFAQRGGDVVQICVFMTDIHIIGLKIGLKRHKFVFL